MGQLAQDYFLKPENILFLLFSRNLELALMH
jgi:hypothetical protein